MQKRAGCEGPRRSVVVRSYPSPEVRSSNRERQAATAQERRPRGASPRLRSGVAAKRSYPTSKVRAAADKSYPTPEVRGGGRRETIPPVQGKEQQLRFAGAAVKRYPTSQVRETQVRQ